MCSRFFTDLFSGTSTEYSVSMTATPHVAQNLLYSCVQPASAPSGAAG
jgi:hypothetical protein